MGSAAVGSRRWSSSLSMRSHLQLRAGVESISIDIWARLIRIAIAQAYPVFDRVNSSINILVGFQFARLPLLILIYITISSRHLKSRIGSIATIEVSVTVIMASGGSLLQLSCNFILSTWA